MTIEQKVVEVTDKLKKDVSGLMQLRVDVVDEVQLGLYVRGSGESSVWMSKGLPGVCLSWGRLRSFVKNFSDNVVHFDIGVVDYVDGGVSVSYPGKDVIFGEFYDVDAVLPLKSSNVSLYSDILANPDLYYLVGKRVDGGVSFADSVEDLSAFINPVLRDTVVDFDTGILRDVYEYVFDLSDVPLGMSLSLFVGAVNVASFVDGVCVSDYLDTGLSVLSGRSLSLVFDRLVGGNLLCVYQVKRLVFKLSESGARKVFTGYFQGVSRGVVSVYVDDVELGSFDASGVWSGVGLSSLSSLNWDTGEVYLEFLDNTSGSYIYFVYGVSEVLGVVTVDTLVYRGVFGEKSPVVGSCRVYLDGVDGQLVAVEEGGVFVGDMVADGSLIDYDSLRFTLRLKSLPTEGSKFVLVYSYLDGYDEWSKSYVEVGFDLSDFRYTVKSGRYSLDRLSLGVSVVEPVRVYSSLFVKSRLSHQVVASFLSKTECMDFRYGVDVVNDDPDTFIKQTLSDFRSLLGVYGEGSDDVFKSASSNYQSSNVDVWRNPFFPYTEYTDSYTQYPYSGESPLFGSQIVFSDEENKVVKFRVYPDVKWTYSSNVVDGSVLPLDRSSWVGDLSSFVNANIRNLNNPAGSGSGSDIYRVSGDGLIHIFRVVSGDDGSGEEVDRGALACTYNDLYSYFALFNNVVTFLNGVLNYTGFKDVISDSNDGVRVEFDSRIRQVKGGLVVVLNRVLQVRRSPLTSAVSMSDIAEIKSSFSELYGVVSDLLSFIDGLLGYVKQSGGDTVGFNPIRSLGSYTQVLYDTCSFMVSKESGGIGSVNQLFESVDLVLDQIRKGQQEVKTWRGRM